MTNAQILQMECMTKGITEQVHTYAKWKQLGFKVKRGEKALFHTMLWKMSTKKKEAEADDDEKVNGRMFLCKSYLFGESQVEEMEK